MKHRLNKAAVFIAAGALALTAVPLLSATMSGASAKKPTYTIAAQFALSGGDAGLGIPEVDGVKLAVANWNANPKRKFNVALVTGDDQCDPTIAPSVATEINSNKKVVAVIGPSCSGATVASLPIYGPTDMAVVSPSATRVSITLPDPTASPPVTTPTNAQYKDFFRVVANDGVQGPADGNYIVKTLKDTNVEVINDASSYGAGLASQVAQQATSDGATVTTATLPSTTACGEGGSGTSDQITIPSSVTAVFYGGYYCDFAQLTDIVRTAGYKGVLMSGDGSDEPQYMEDLSKLSDGAGALVTCACSEVSSTTPAGKTFNVTFQKKFKTVPGAYAPESYDATNMVLTAMTKIPKVSRKAITAELKKLTYVGVSKTIKFAASGDVNAKNIYVYKVVITNNPTGFSSSLNQIAVTTP
jgi:branched-chain amino acid transport system substrate-binding protein